MKKNVIGNSAYYIVEYILSNFIRWQSQEIVDMA
jgi:putative flippase GtrA